MPRKLKTMGDLRGALLDLIEGVRNGTVAPDKASAIVKIAAQVNNTLMAEIEASRLAITLKRSETAFGELQIAPDRDDDKVIEHAPVPSPLIHRQAVPDLSRARVTDHRVPGKVDMGDPPPGRSALDQRRAAG